MQDELRITLFVIGSAFIVGILLHGVWTMRKNKKINKPNSFQPRHSEPKFAADDYRNFDEEEYDDVSISEARVISVADETPYADPASAEAVDTDDVQITSVNGVADSIEDIDKPEIVSVYANDDSQSLAETADTASLSDAEDVSIHAQRDEEVSNVRPFAKPPQAAKPLEDTLTDGEHDHEGTSKANEQNPESAPSDSAPMYPDVVSQPKPEFNRPSRAKESNEDVSMPAPPNFLLKKADGTLAQTSDEAAAQDKSSDSSPSTDTLDDATDSQTPDFSLDVQEGPVKSKETSQVSQADEMQGVEKELSFAEQAKRFVRRRKKTVAEKIRKEPQVRGGAKSSDDQMRIDFENREVIGDDGNMPQESMRDSSVGSASHVSSEQKSAHSSTKNDAADQPTDVLVLNVRANAENPISGAALLPMLLTLGFKFGEHDIFHRHVNTNGKGPILFSLTNMFKPGVFDIDNMENFSTLGVSLFMMLPIEGEAQQVFNMMHNAARKISEEFNCAVLDGNKVLLSKQSLQQYSERIREFERLRHSR